MAEPEENLVPLKLKLHGKYFKRFLDVLPADLSHFDCTRVTIAYFSIAGLDLLNSLDILPLERRECIIDWFYSFQVVDDKELVSGFQGSSTLNTDFNVNKNSPYKWGHLAATYCALCSLVVLEDDLSKVNRSSVIRSLKRLQLDNGCFTAAVEGTESDMRFLFCAASVSYILNDWSGLDKDKATDFILKSISYDQGIGQGPGLEAHGGSAYCAIASLALMDRLSALSESQRQGLIRWLMMRQEDGFQGRPNKPVDTCYSFWIGAALKILGAFHLVDYPKNRSFVMSTQGSVQGGFSKWVYINPDPLHAYLGLGGLSLMEEPGLQDVIPSLNISRKAFEHLKRLHEKWETDK